MNQSDNDSPRDNAHISGTQGIDSITKRLEPELMTLRRQLHAHPEPSGEEVETTRCLHDRLTQLGLNPRIYRSDAGNEVGLTADLDLGDPAEDAPRIAVRGDIDALRVPDQKQVAYRSQNPGVAHACGHDAHAAIVMGLAMAGSQLVSQNGCDFPGGGLRLRLVFQPAEETSSGARWLVEQGAMDGVSGILGMHVDPERAAGEVGIRYGVLTAYCDETDIAVRGHGGHSARPHHTTDPIAASAQLIAALYQYLPRSVDSRDPSVFTIGQINGGYAPNVIPEDVKLRGSLRTTNSATRERLKERIRGICNGVQISSGAEVSVAFSSPLNAVHNDSQFASALEQASRSVLGPENVKRIDRPSLGGEDFSVYLDHVPGAMLRLGCGKPEGPRPFLHSPLFDLDERCLGIGLRILYRAAVHVAANAQTTVQEPP